MLFIKDDLKGKGKCLMQRSSGQCARQSCGTLVFVFVKGGEERSSKFRGGELVMTPGNFSHHSQCWELQAADIGNITGFSIPALH